MKPTRLWTGIAALALTLTVAEAAAVTVIARGAQQWWEGDDARALRRAGSIVGEAIAQQIGIETDGLPVRVDLANLRSVLEPVAFAWSIDAREPGSCRCGSSTRAQELRARLRALEAHAAARARLREMIRRGERTML